VLDLSITGAPSLNGVTVPFPCLYFFLTGFAPLTACGGHQYCKVHPRYTHTCTAATLTQNNVFCRSYVGCRMRHRGQSSLSSAKTYGWRLQPYNRSVSLTSLVMPYRIYHWFFRTRLLAHLHQERVSGVLIQVSL